MLTQPKPGIFAQKEHFRAASAQLEKARAECLATHNTDGDAKDMFSANDAPRYLRELLSVCSYCHEAASNFAVAIAYPPAHLQERMVEAQSTTSHNSQPSYLNRTDGRAAEAWLDAYRIPFEIVATSKTWTGEKASSRFRGEITGGSSEDLLGTKQEPALQQRRKGSPTPSISSSTGSFKSELSGLSMFSGSHKSPRHRQEGRFCNATSHPPPLRGVRCMSTSTSASAVGNPEDDEQEETDGSIYARPSSAASSHTSSFTTSTTHDEWSSQSSACGTRITRHNASTNSAAMDAEGEAAKPTRLTSRTMLHKTKSGAEKMEEYLRRLEALSASGGVERGDGATPTPGSGSARH